MTAIICDGGENCVNKTIELSVPENEEVVPMKAVELTSDQLIGIITG